MEATKLNFPEGEKWVWLEVYKDGKMIPQFDENSVSRHFYDIDQKNLEAFLMVHESGKIFEIPVSHEYNWRLIHFYRCIKRFGKEQSYTRFPIAGYQITKYGRNFKVLVAFHDDGNTSFVYE